VGLNSLDISRTGGKEGKEGKEDKGDKGDEGNTGTGTGSKNFVGSITCPFCPAFRFNEFIILGLLILLLLL
jgi:hypothetical protein